MSNPALSNSSSATAQGMNRTLTSSVESLTEAAIQQQLLRRFNLPSAWMVGDNERDQAVQRIFGGHVASETQPMAVKYPYALLKADQGDEVDPERGNIRAMTKFGIPIKVNDSEDSVMMFKYIPITMRVSLEYVTNDIKELRKFGRQLLHARVQGWLHCSVQIGQASFGITIRPDATTSTPMRPSDEGSIKEFAATFNLEVKTWSTLETMVEQQVIRRVELDAGIPENNSSSTFWSFRTPTEDPTVPVAVVRSKST